jgi:hypothetical protein
MNLTPRAKFQADKTQSRAHQDLVTNEGFRNACQAALLEQILGMPSVTDPIEQAAAYNRIMGATEYLRHLLSIAEQTPPPKEKLPQNLNYATH